MPSGCVIVLFYKYVAVPDVAETRGLLHDKCTEFGDCQCHATDPRTWPLELCGEPSVAAGAGDFGSVA